MDMERQIACDQLLYKKPVSIVTQFLDFVLDLRVQSHVNVRPNWPMGWRAEVVAEDKVWTIECNRGDINLIRVGDYAGTRVNGQYIIAAEEDVSKDERHYLQGTSGGGVDIMPLTCDIFCQNEEARCIFCPYKRGRRR